MVVSKRKAAEIAGVKIAYEEESHQKPTKGRTVKKEEDDYDVDESDSEDEPFVSDQDDESNDEVKKTTPRKKQKSVFVADEKSRSKKVSPNAHNHETNYHYFSDENEKAELRKNLLAWYDQEKRDLPWRFEEVSSQSRKNADVSEEQNNRAYAIWVSEIMLQQTRVQTVIDYFTRWIKKWPTVHDLAKATLEEVNEMWSGLGYYRRAKFLHAGAQRVVEKYKGLLPTTSKELEDIPGIGKYTAGAIASIAFGEVTPLVDGNVIRVLSRVRSIGLDPKSKNAIKLHWDLAEKIVDPNRPGSFNQSLMELGATVCTATNPLCDSCPIKNQCHAFQEVEALQKAASKKLTGETKESGTIANMQCNVCLEDGEVDSPTQSVTKYPLKVKKAAPREESVSVSLIEWQTQADNVPQSKYLIVQRPNTGLLASLWEFPQCAVVDPEEQANLPSGFSQDIKKRMDDYIAKNLGLNNLSVVKRQHLGSFVHVFSHIRQTMSVEWILIDDCQEDSISHKKNGEKKPSKSNSKKGKSSADTEESNTKNTRWVNETELHGSAVSKSVKKCLDLLKEHKKGKKVKPSKSPKKAKPTKSTTPTKETTKGKQSLISAMFQKK